MAGWRSLHAVVPNYLSTFTSRYRDRDGWWLLGLAESSLDGLAVDLLGNTPCPDSSPNQLEHDAVYLFQDQMKKHGVSLSLVAEATLQCSRAEASRRIAGDHLRDGHDFTFLVHVKTTNGNEIWRNRTVFVSPHDPTKERRASGHLTTGCS